VTVHELVHDRRRTVELFGFDYQLEMYKPAAKRRWGYFALPVPAAVDHEIEDLAHWLDLDLMPR
jgi:uncharacterized protein YcaQ